MCATGSLSSDKMGILARPLAARAGVVGGCPARAFFSGPAKS
jgi:hypothetical protein